MILFYICGAVHIDRDLFVSARSREEAVDLWRGWVTEYLGKDAEHNAQPANVFIVPKLRETPGAHGWHHIPHETAKQHGVLVVSRKWDALETIAHAINHGITSYSQGNTKVIVE